MSEGLTFFRCTVCHGVVSVWDAKQGGCKKCGGHHIKPSSLTWLEKIIQILKHPNVWSWPEDKDWRISTLEESLKKGGE